MKNFDIAKIAASGQCFRFTPVPGKAGVYEVIAHNKRVEITNTPDGKGALVVDINGEDLKFWRWYFDLDTDYTEFAKGVDPADKFLTAAIEYGAGIKILRQELWEMLVTWQLSPCNTVGNIAAAIKNICDRYGETLITSSGKEYKGFPTPERLTDQCH